MENANNNYTRFTTEAAAASAGENPAAAASGLALPPEFLAPCLADLKRQIALRQAMP